MEFNRAETGTGNEETGERGWDLNLMAPSTGEESNGRDLSLRLGFSASSSNGREFNKPEIRIGGDKTSGRGSFMEPRGHDILIGGPGRAERGQRLNFMSSSREFDRSDKGTGVLETGGRGRGLGFMTSSSEFSRTDFRAVGQDIGERSWGSNFTSSSRQKTRSGSEESSGVDWTLRLMEPSREFNRRQIRVGGEEGARRDLPLRSMASCRPEIRTQEDETCRRGRTLSLMAPYWQFNRKEIRIRGEESSERGRGSGLIMASSRELNEQEMRIGGEESGERGQGLDFMAESREFNRPNIRTRGEETGGRGLIFTVPSREFNRQNISTGGEETGGRGLGFMAPSRDLNRQNIRTGGEETGSTFFAPSRSSEMRTGGEESGERGQGWDSLAVSRPNIRTRREETGGRGLIFPSRQNIRTGGEETGGRGSTFFAPSRSSEMRTGGEESGERGQGWDVLAVSRDFNRPNIRTGREETGGRGLIFPSRDLNRQYIRTGGEETGGRSSTFFAPSRSSEMRTGGEESGERGQEWDVLAVSRDFNRANIRTRGEETGGRGLILPSREFSRQNIRTGGEETGGIGLGLMAPSRDLNRQNIRTGEEETGGRGSIFLAPSRSSEMGTRGEESRGRGQGWPLTASSRPEIRTVGAASHDREVGVMGFTPSSRLRTVRRNTYWTPEMAAEKARSKPSAPLACPFCNSLETIFRYFIDYDVKRRRHFCKNCDRHFAAVKSRSSEIITGGEESRGRDQGWTFMASSREFNRPEVGTVGEASHGLEGGVMGLTAPSGGYWKSGMAAERARLKPTTPVACPRCHSLKTRFRYFNNYDIKQPRFVCDNCDRDWTAGGRKRERYIGFQRDASKLLHVQEPDGEIQNSKEPVNEARISSFDDELTRVSSVTGEAGIDLNVPGREETGGANPDGFVDSLTVDGVSGTEFSNLMDTGRKRKATSTENSE